VEQESLANAKASARSGEAACVWGPGEEIYDKSTQEKLKSTFSSGLQKIRT